MAEHRKNPGMSKDEAKVAFLKKMESWTTFGSVFFEAQVNLLPFIKVILILLMLIAHVFLFMLYYVMKHNSKRLVKIFHQWSLWLSINMAST